MSWLDSKSRGLRNRNPFNIKKDVNNHWLGQNGDDGTFCKFVSLDYGVRAAIKLFKTYVVRRHLTIQGMVHRFCPDNPLYIEFVQRGLERSHGIPASAFQHRLLMCDDLKAEWFYEFLRLLIRYENGLSYGQALSYGFTNDYFVTLIKTFKLL